MYICEKCKRQLKPHNKPIKKVVKTRAKIYPERLRGKDVIDKGGAGMEIVRELSVCEECYG